MRAGAGAGVRGGPMIGTLYGSRGSSRRIGGVVVTLVAGLLAGGGLAWAAIPHSSTGVISGCYQTGGATPGALRVIDFEAGQRCSAGETLLTWNQTGINFKGAWVATTAYTKNDAVTYAGSSFLAKAKSTGVFPTDTRKWAVLAAQGATGSQGPTGAQGPAGPSNAYHGYTPGPVEVSVFGPTVVGGPTFPAQGSYVISAKLWVSNTSSTLPGAVRCALVAQGNSGPPQESRDVDFVNLLPLENKTLAFQLGVDGATQANFECQSENGNDAMTMLEMRVTAVRVGSLTLFL